MATTFIENLWNSVFTPGTTPTLLIATNVSFAALQVVLALLLAATGSIHFVVLSTICGGLWWSINWFANEIRKAEKAEEEAGRLRKRRSNMSEKRELDRDTTDYTGDDSTETETEIGEGVKVWGGPQKAQAVMESAAAAREETPVIQTRGGPGKPQAVMESAGMTGEEYSAVRTRGGPQKAQAVMESAGITGEDYSPVQIRGGPQKIQAVMDSAAAAQAERDEAAGYASGIQIRGGPEKIAAVLGLTPEGEEAQSSAGADQKVKSAEHGETGSVSTDSEWEKISDR